MKLKDLKALLNNPDEEAEIDLGIIKNELRIINPEFSTEIPIEGVSANVKHSCNPGDVVASLIACKRYYEIRCFICLLFYCT